MAKKRYYQNAMDRADESYKGSRHRRSGGFDPSSGIMGDDPSMMANMPRESKCEEFTPLATHNYDMDDTIRRVGEQVRRDVSKVKRNVNFAYEK